MGQDSGHRQGLWRRCYGGGLFGTDDPITREQLVTMLHRFAQLIGKA